MATTTETVAIRTNVVVEDNKTRAPLQLTGALNEYKSFDVTPVIGREFPEASLKEWLEAPNADELLQDLAVTSMLNLWTQGCISTDDQQSHAAASSSFESRTTLTTSCRRSWYRS